MKSPKAKSKRHPGWEIKGPEVPAPWERMARDELDGYFPRVVRSLKIAGCDSPVIWVGNTETARRNGVDASRLESEQWVMRSCPEGLLLAGGGTRGTLYAVYHFLEDILGIHWWNPNEEEVPPLSDFDLPELAGSGRPYFLMREICRGEMFPDDEGRFSARNRLNRSGYEKLCAAYGGGYDFGPPFFVHTYDHYLPAAQYFDSHPEYFSLWEGKRVGGQSLGQLCLSQTVVREIFWDKLQAYIAAGDAEAAKRGVRPPVIYEISHNDNERFCQCDACLAVIDQDGHSGLMLRFVNELAGRLHAIRPELYLCVLAYYRTANPPRHVVPRENVIVRLCDTFSNCAAPISAPENATYRNRVKEWSAIASNLSIWDYSINYREDSVALPYPSEFLYPETHRFYAEHHVKWMFWEHEWPDCADMYDYKVFLEAKYLEDPFRNDFEILRRTFMDGYFGPAAGLMIAYRDRLWQAAQKNHAMLGGFSCCRSDFTFIDLAALLDCHRIFERAGALVSSPIHSRRVARARLGVDGLVGFALTEFYRDAWESKNAGPFPIDPEAARRRVMAAWQTAGEPLRPHPVVEAYQRQIRAGRQDRGSLILPQRQARAGEREYHLTREMICCEGPGVELLPATSRDLVRMTLAGDHEVELISGVSCIVDDVACLESHALETPEDELPHGFEWTFEIPQTGGVWFFRKHRLDIVHPVQIRLDFLKRMGFATPGRWTVELRMRCAGVRFGGKSQDGGSDEVILSGISIRQSFVNSPLAGQK